MHWQPSLFGSHAFHLESAQRAGGCGRSGESGNRLFIRTLESTDMRSVRASRDRFPRGREKYIPASLQRNARVTLRQGKGSRRYSQFCVGRAGSRQPCPPRRSPIRRRAKPEPDRDRQARSGWTTRSGIDGPMGGNVKPMMDSISPKVVFHSCVVSRHRCVYRGWFFPLGAICRYWCSLSIAMPNLCVGAKGKSRSDSGITVSSYQPFDFQCTSYGLARAVPALPLLPDRLLLLQVDSCLGPEPT